MFKMIRFEIMTRNLIARRGAIWIILLSWSLADPPTWGQSSNDSITDKIICGYQGWFNCYGDASPAARWVHWSMGQYQTDNGKPAPGHLSFEMYPDVSGYKSSSLFQTGFSNQGDGNPSRLFSSYIENVIDTHFVWMKKYGIDGVALQRFISATSDVVYRSNLDSVAARVRRASEKHGRVFYLMYDISGLDTSKFGSLKTDWQNNMVGKLKLPSSPMYAKQKGKPVVCIWGFGFINRPGNATQCLDVINWFKAQGCYVIGGVPANWQTGTGDSKPGFENVYKAFNMISPWSVGRFNDASGIDNYKTKNLIPDQLYCQSNGIHYQPVCFSGFAWSNWNGGAPNTIPRNKGEFFWRQFYNIKQLGITSLYIAMFDEYDEATAILKAADSYYMIPTNQYFLTTSADGTYLSSDFYLRLVGKAGNINKGTDPLTANVSIPFSQGPIYFRTSLELKYDAIPNWTDSINSSTGVIGMGGIGKPRCTVVAGAAHLGNYALRYSGEDNSSNLSNCYFKVFDVHIPVFAETKFSFWVYPETVLARYTSIDLVFTDGTSFKDYNAVDINGLSMKPGQGRGAVNAWTETFCNLGQWLNGKTIDKIMVAYDHNPDTGYFLGSIDDIQIFTSNSIVNDIQNSIEKPAACTIIYPNPASEKVTIENTNNSLKEINVSIFNITGQKIMSGKFENKNKMEIDVSRYAKGIYLVKMQTETESENKKLILY